MAGTDPKGAAFITGGSSGIGLELARLLAREGHPLALFARNADRLDAAAAEIHDELPDARIALFPVDVSDRAACTQAVAEAAARLGPPAWAIANAGIAEPGEFLHQSLDSHDAQMQINYMGALYFAKPAADLMAAAGGGNLVFVSSGAAFFGIYGYSAYAPSKFAMRGLAEVLRVELAPCGISVTLACPPDTDTPQLGVEYLTKPAVTQKITAGGGLWTAIDVAELILRRARRGRFIAAPGLQMVALAFLHSLIAAPLRLWQGLIVRRIGR